VFFNVKHPCAIGFFFSKYFGEGLAGSFDGVQCAVLPVCMLNCAVCMLKSVFSCWNLQSLHVDLRMLFAYRCSLCALAKTERRVLKLCILAE
jgi:hypothetical protein